MYPADDWWRHEETLRPSDSAPIGCPEGRDGPTGGLRAEDSAPRRWEELYRRAGRAPLSWGQLSRRRRCRHELRPQKTRKLRENTAMAGFGPCASIARSVP